jgi:bacterioferritin-associated ferredoxin
MVMYICLCKAVTDSEIVDAIDQGAHQLSHLEETLRVGTGCGCCRDSAQQLIDERLSETSFYAA